MATPRPCFARPISTQEAAVIIADQGWILLDDSDEAVADMLVGAGIPLTALPIAEFDAIKLEARRLSLPATHSAEA